MDLERYVGMADLDELEQYLLECKVAHRNTFIIVKTLAAEGYDLSEARVRTLQRKIIPRKIAAVATRERLLSQMTRKEIPTQICHKCRTLLPLDNFFYSRDRSSTTGFCRTCKDCQKKRTRRGTLNG